MQYDLYKSVSDAFEITQFNDYSKMLLAVDIRDLQTLDMREAHANYSAENLQLLYNQFLIRWFFGLKELTPYLWGPDTPYNSTDFKDAFTNTDYTTYKYGMVFAKPHNVLYSNVDYFYHREAFRLLYNFMANEQVVVSNYSRYIIDNIYEHKDVLMRHVRELKMFFYDKLLPAVDNCWFDVVADRQVKLSEYDKAYLDQLHALAEKKDSLYTSDLICELSRIYRITEEIIK